MSAAMPFIGPGEDEDAGAAGFEDAGDLPFEGFALLSVAVAEAIEADFGHDEWAIARDVLQAGEIGFEAVFGFEVDVEAGEVEEGEMEIFC